jgi:hypothetical protein
MEMTRRLKVATEKLTDVTVTAGASADRASSRILWLDVLLTAALVALSGGLGGPELKPRSSRLRLTLSAMTATSA